MDVTHIKKAFEIKMLADKLSQEKKYSKALELYSSALKICTKNRSRLGIAEICEQRGNVYSILGEHHKAIIDYERSVGLFEENGDLGKVSYLYYELGNAYRWMADYNNSKIYFNKSKEYCVTTHHNKNIISIDIALASIEIKEGNILTALSMLKKCKLFAQKCNEHESIFHIELNIATVNSMLGHLDKALDGLEECKKYYISTNDLSQVAAICQNQAQILRDKCRYKDAKILSEQAFDIYHNLGNKTRFSTSLMQLAEICNELNQHKKALEYCNNARAIFNELTNGYHLGIIDRIEAEILLKTEDFHDAISLLENASEKVQNDPHELGLVYRGYAIYYGLTQDIELAIENWELFKKILVNCNKYWDADTVDLNIASLLIGAGRNDDAISLLDKTIAKNKVLGEIYYQVPLTYSRAYRNDNLRQSIEYLKQAIFLLENNRSNLDSKDLPLYSGDKVLVYWELIDLLFDNELYNDALHYSEMARARQFFEYDKASSFSYIQSNSFSWYPGISYDHIKQYYDESCVFVGLFSTSKRLYIFLFDCNGLIAVNYFLMDYDEVKEMLLIVDSCFDFTLDETKGYALIPDSFFNFSSMLCSFLKNHISEGKLLIFLQHIALNYLPFNALCYKHTENGQSYLRFLIEDYSIVRSSSFNMMSYSRALDIKENTNAFILGNPNPPGNLFYSEYEANEVGKLLNATPHIGIKANLDNFIKKVPKSNIIHIASHGKFEVDDIEKSGFLLSDGIINIDDILKMDFNTSLVFLAACDTGRTKLSYGDDMISIVRAFLEKSKSAVASLWHSDDKVNMEIVVDFYKYWRGKRVNKAQALQHAQVNFIQKSRINAMKKKEPVFTINFKGLYNRKLHPYYWASLQLYGDWE